MPGIFCTTRRIFAPILWLLTLTSCREVAPDTTGLRVTSTWAGLGPTQLEFSVIGATGVVLGTPERRPLTPGAPLSSGTDVVILLRDDLGGQTVRCRVTGRVAGAVVGAGESQVTVLRGKVADVGVALGALVPVLETDAGAEDDSDTATARSGDAGLDRPVSAADSSDLDRVDAVAGAVADAPMLIDAPKESDVPSAADARPDAATGRDAPTNRPVGMACSMANECKSGQCFDGVCCESACVGICQSCSVAGREGTCSFLGIGVRDRQCAELPATSCGYDGTCDGQGLCRKHPAGTQCMPGSCSGSSIIAAGACDGKGKCDPGPVITCAPFLCDEQLGNPRCFAGCMAPTQCISGVTCANGSCGRKPSGGTCILGAECASGFCTDGVCCNTRCGGSCSSCNLPGSKGSCQLVPLGVKDPRSLCVDKGAPSCSTNGTCDGTGQCAVYPQGAVCKPAVCASTAVVTPPSRCDGVGVCVVGDDVACEPFLCRNGACTSTCAVNEDCTAPSVCDARGSCGKKGVGQPCGMALDCGSGFCADGVCCNESCQGACRSCSAGTTPGMCTPTGVGVVDPRAMCLATAASACGADGTCDGAGACRKHPAGTVCAAAACSAATNDRQLPSTCDGMGSCAVGATSTCAPYRCNSSACFSACGTDADCAPPNVCTGGTCGLKSAGIACTAGTQCSSGNCVDGVCCGAMTCGPCRACNVAGFVGACAPVAAGNADPRTSCAADLPTTCALDGKCDGAGACRKFPAGTVCAPSACLADGLTLTLPSACDGAGTCTAGATQPCAPFACNATAPIKACHTSCATDNECAAPNLCGVSTKICGNLKGLGQICTGGLECASGSCVDGVCCGSPTCGSCKACNVVGAFGTCTNVPAGSDDPRGLCASTAPATCGLDGKCDGAGACRSHVVGTVCVAASCTGNTTIPASLCSGTGVCTAPGTGADCGAYKCGGGTCSSTCTADADCSAPFSCIGSSCQKKATGSACTTGPQCTSGNCVDGVCCGSATCTSCLACNIPGFEGTCTNVPTGTVEPHARCAVQATSTCGTTGKCNGAGVCQKWASGTVCVAGSCGMTGRYLTKNDTCNGAGVCVDQGTQDCSLYSCDSVNLRCFSSCSSASQCCCGNSCKSGQCR